MKFARRLALLAGGAALTLAPETTHAQVILTNAGTWQACNTGAAAWGPANGNSCGGEFWDSNPNGTWSDNFWSAGGAPATLGSTPIQLSVGVNTLSFYQDMFGFDPWMGLDLAFNGSVTAQIGGWNSEGAGGVNAFNGVPTFFNAVGGPLSFVDNGYQVTLTGFSYAPGPDVVPRYEDGADAPRSDWHGTVTLDVETATPEPATFALFATGLAAVFFMRRRRAA